MTQYYRKHLYHYKQPRDWKIESIRRKISKDPFSYIDLDIKYKNEVFITYNALIREESLFSSIPIHFQEDIEFLKNVLSQNEKIFFEIDIKKRTSKVLVEIFIEKISKNNTEVEESIYFEKALGKKYFTNPENILYLANLLERYCSKFVLENFTPKVFSLINDSFKNDSEFLGKLVQRCPAMFSLIKPYLQDEPDFLVEVMKKTQGHVFPHFHEEFRSDPFFVYKMNEINPVNEYYLKGKAKNLVSTGINIDKFKSLVDYDKLMNDLSNDNKPHKKLKV